MSDKHPNGRSGILDSPYGAIRMVFDDKFWPNGTRVINNKIQAETLEHYVPDHWIKDDATMKQTKSVSRVGWIDKSEKINSTWQFANLTDTASYLVSLVAS